MSHDDDAPVGRLLDRRTALRLLGAAALAACSPRRTDTGALASPDPAGATTAAPATASPAAAVGAGTSASAAPAAVSSSTCVVRPELTEGPFFVDEKLNRADIRSDPSDGSVVEGVPLQVEFVVSRMSSGGCTALDGAMVDLWHCDALGRYSDVSGGTDGKKFLRGYQLADARGRTTFRTIYPGFYRGRTIHLHFKIRAAGREFTSQLFFDEAVNDAVLARSPYTQAGRRDQRNSSDDIYDSQLLLPVTKDGDGYRGTFDIALQM